MTEITFRLNGEEVTCEVDGDELLIHTIRERFNLKGTKQSCGTGDCGSCTVLLNGRAIRSCIYLTCMVAGKEVTTIEGVAKEGEELHPIQTAFIEVGAAQCGYCTPGMVLAGVALLNENPNPTLDDIKLSLSGNLCRCTGYFKIFEGIQIAAKRMAEAKKTLV